MLAVLGWRLVNFWMPIPLGAGCYVSLRFERIAGRHNARAALAELRDLTNEAKSAAAMETMDEAPLIEEASTEAAPTAEAAAPTDEDVEGLSGMA